MPDIQFPVYIPSKGRADRRGTGAMFDAADMPFLFVVEPQDADA